jgi:lipopolysaccharide biosynthesis glycosyltransferase
VVQRQPKLRIVPDVFRTQREGKCGGWRELGYLPIFEKENAFELLDDYDQILILDADIYIRPDASNIFEELGSSYAFGGVSECSMPISAQHMAKIKQYSHMQYQSVGSNMDSDRWKYETSTGFEFYNMGLMLVNTEQLKPFLRGQTPREFLMRPEFQDMLDGVGYYKWSTDQTLLNYWLRRDRIPHKNLDWKYNGLYGSLQKGKITDCEFVHFYLKDKLPMNGENVEALMREIDNV